MTSEQWKLYKDFCEYAGFQDNSDAEIPNAFPGVKVLMEGSGIKGWDCIGDSLAMVSPEMLVYTLIKAKDFFKKGDKNVTD